MLVGLGDKTRNAVMFHITRILLGLAAWYWARAALSARFAVDDALSARRVLRTFGARHSIRGTLRRSSLRPLRCSRSMRRNRSDIAALLVLAVVTNALLGDAAACAEDNDWTGTILEEDDFWAPQNHDRHYTHGIRFSGTSGDVCGDWQKPFDWVNAIAPAAFPGTACTSATGAETIARRYNLILFGQNMYTPENPYLSNPDPRDRPYAGWDYGGVGLMQDTPGTSDGIDRFDELALKLGLVGPGTLAHDTQTRFHLLINVAPFQGWHAQLHDEPTLDLFYQRKWRFRGEDPGGWGWDAIPQWDWRVGNVYDYLGAGGMLRFGRNLRADYGPPHIDLNTGADYINPTRMTKPPWGFYTFVGSELRAVAHNIFLDGNDFKSSAHVEKYPAVADLEGGLAVLYGHWRFSYTYIWRTPEFVHQTGADHYAVLDLTVHLKWPLFTP
jgi:lipid A 3-O-deacylase